MFVHLGPANMSMESARDSNQSKDLHKVGTSCDNRLRAYMNERTWFNSVVHHVVLAPRDLKFKIVTYSKTSREDS